VDQNEDGTGGGIACLPHPAHCLPWCAQCRHDNEPPGAVLHRGTADTVGVYGEACDLVDAHIRIAWWDKSADWIGTDPADLERPHVEVSIPGEDGDVQLYLSPDQARAFAAALLGAADTADTADAAGARHRSCTGR
jgi:hypothetical protein